MFTSWDQVQSWIEDNGLNRWIFYTSRPSKGDDDKADKVLDSNNYGQDKEDKLAMTEKYLKMYGQTAYGIGYPGQVVCTVRLESAAQPTQGVGGQNIYNIGELTDQITKRVRAEIEAENMRKREADIERREREFEKEKQSALGAIVHYFAPIGQMMLQKKVGMPMVAGVDANEPVHAAPIIPDRKPQEPGAEQEQENEQELVDMANESVFTDEEEAKIYDLISRFKKVEPDYLKLIEAVVTMAENGDSTYTMAKGFLIK